MHLDPQNLDTAAHMYHQHSSHTVFIAKAIYYGCQQKGFMQFTTFKDGDLQVYGSYSSDRINSTDITQSLQRNLAHNEKKKKVFF